MRTLLLAFALCSAPLHAADTSKSNPLDDGLVPSIIFKGETPQRTPVMARMAQLRIPGASVAFIHDGGIEWTLEFGVARKGGTLVTPDTVFQAASVSKLLTALLVMRLVEEGRLQLDTDANNYLKTWKVPQNEFTRKSRVTLRRLLSHSAGVELHGFSAARRTF